MAAGRSDKVVLQMIQKCTGWIVKDKKRIETEGIFRISGSVAKIGVLVEKMQKEISSAKHHVDLDQEDVHTVAGAMKRTLIDLEPPLITPQIFDDLIEAISNSASVQQMLSTFRRLLCSLSETRIEILCTVLRFLREVVKCKSTNKMNSANLCKVFAASILRHPDSLKTALNLGCGRLPKIALALLVSDCILESTFHPEEMRACRDGELEDILKHEFRMFDEVSSPKFEARSKSPPTFPVASKDDDEWEDVKSNRASTSEPSSPGFKFNWMAPWQIVTDNIRLPRIGPDFLRMNMPWDSSGETQNLDGKQSEGADSEAIVRQHAGRSKAMARRLSEDSDDYENVAGSRGEYV